MRKQRIDKPFVSSLMACANPDVKANFSDKYPDAKQSTIPYLPPSEGVTFNWWGDGWSAAAMNELDAAEAYFGNTWTWWGQHPFYLFITGNHEDPEITSWIRRTTLFAGRQARLDEMLDNSSAYHPFLGPLIRDTANFILTGKRQMPIRLMHEMMLQHHTMHEDNKYDGPFEVPLVIRPRGDMKELFCLTPQEFFLRWARQKNGVADMIAAHKMMFGN